MEILLCLALLSSPSFAAGVPAVGAAAPAFTLPAQDGKPVSLKDQRGKWVVLYFYPKDFTGGCTLEAHGFQKALKRFAAANAVVLGVSMDTAESHKDFCAKEGLNFKLLADETGEISKAYGSVTNLGVTKLSARNTFLIDPDGILAKAFLKVSPAKHSEEVLAAIAQLGTKPSVTR